MWKQICETTLGFVIVVGGIALAIALLYGTYYIANSQIVTDALVATGHYHDVRATATAQARADFEAAVHAEVERRMAEAGR